jgi:hypothetical protein
MRRTFQWLDTCGSPSSMNPDRPLPRRAIEMREPAPFSVLYYAETSQLYTSLIPSVGIGRASATRGPAPMRSGRPGMAGAGAFLSGGERRLAGAQRQHAGARQDDIFAHASPRAPAAVARSTNKQENGRLDGGARRPGRARPGEGGRTSHHPGDRTVTGTLTDLCLEVCSPGNKPPSTPPAAPSPWRQAGAV